MGEYHAEMRWLASILLAAAAPAAAGTPTTVVPAAPLVPGPGPALWNPVAPYITAGQDEPGYRSWYLAAPWRAAQVRSFNDYLASNQVAGVVPTWQLLRTATSWHKCGGQPFEVPPTGEWPHIVQTLRYIHGFVVPAVGPVEAVSGYRNPSLNACAGGAPESAHKHYSAIDLVPLRPTSREDLMRTLCAVHARRGTDYAVGLGFYAFLRFHVDTTKYRRWGADSSTHTLCPPIIRPVDLASVAQPQAVPVAPATSAAPKTVVSPAQAAPDAPGTAAPPTPPVTTGPQVSEPELQRQ